MPNALIAARNRILPALVTPLTDSGALDEASLERLIDHLYSSGMGGLYVTGSTGEGIYLDGAIRRRVVEIAVAHSRGHGQVLVHVGSISAMQAFELAKHAASAGADGVSSIPPFVGGYSPAETLDYYRALVAASPLPVVGYYIPQLTGQAWPIERVVELMSLDGMAGFKFTHSDLYVLERVMQHVGPAKIVYFGTDEMLCHGLAIGAHGGIGTTYNFMPKLILEVATLSAERRWDEAREVQKKVNEIVEVLLTFHGIAATKQILVWQGHIAEPRCAPPRASLNAEQQQTLRAKLMNTAIAETLIKE
ncbi:MAG: dihydrodipicolinate synthase family protein [Planctomycetia bacterium]|nr:dihydrodipicolinate synthase family protein [Planctomycetia bacterium]